MKKTRKYILTATIVIVAAGAVVLKYLSFKRKPWTRDGQVSANVVEITPRVSGPIVKLSINNNQFVKAGDLLFTIDPRTFKAAHDQAKAEYDITIDNYRSQEKKIQEANAQVEVSQKQILQAQSTIKEIESEIEKNKAEYKRQKQLLPQKATSQRSLDKAKANYEISLEKHKGAVASLAQAKASLVQAKAALAQQRAKLGKKGHGNANIRKAKAALEQAELNLEFTEVRASVDGYVTNLNLRPGSHAVANQPVLALVDINSYWVYGFFKETSIANISTGDKATVTLMGHPDEPLDGYVESIGWGIAQQDGSTGENLLINVSPTFEWIRLAQRIPVIVRFDEIPKGVKLRMGTTASVQVNTGTSDSEAKK